MNFWWLPSWLIQFVKFYLLMAKQTYIYRRANILSPLTKSWRYRKQWQWLRYGTIAHYKCRMYVESLNIYRTFYVIVMKKDSIMEQLTWNCARPGTVCAHGSFRSFPWSYRTFFILVIKKIQSWDGWLEIAHTQYNCGPFLSFHGFPDIADLPNT